MFHRSDTHLGGTFFLEAPDESTGLVSVDCGNSSALLDLFSAAFKPFTAMTVTKSPVCEAGRFFDGVPLLCSLPTEQDGQL